MSWERKQGQGQEQGGQAGVGGVERGAGGGAIAEAVAGGQRVGHLGHLGLPPVASTSNSSF